MDGNLKQRSNQGIDVSGVTFELGLPIVSETYTNILTYCPFHANNDTPALSISKDEGLWKCFNPSCDASGALIDLVKDVEHINDFQALRFIAKHTAEVSSLSDEVMSILNDNRKEFPEYPSEYVEQLRSLYENSRGEAYMESRGFNKETARHFSIGFSPKMEMVSVPVYSHTDILVGVVGRSIEGKRFKNSKGLPTAHLFYNLNNVKREDDTAIITESSFDAMKLWQCGYTNAIATLGSHVSPYKFKLLNKYFNRIIIMTDNDDAGRKLGNKLADGFVRYAERVSYPENRKDVGEMTLEEIKETISNRRGRWG